MKELTADKCKCLAELAPGVTILDMQLKLLAESGITDVCITTGPFEYELKNYVSKRYPGLNVSFVNNHRFDQTNYIYSIHLAREELQDDDVLLLHGDLVFEHSVLLDALTAPTSVMVTDSTKPLPDKDFKAVISDGKLCRVGVDEFGADACYAQPMYKLLKEDWSIWLNAINHFCKEGHTDVYAENALNSVSNDMNILPLDIKDRICFEIDNMADFAHGIEVYSKYLKPKQQIFEGLANLTNVVKNAKKPFVVVGVDANNINQMLPPSTVYFSEFTPNPSYDEIISGIDLFEAEKCDFIISIGGGSAIDVAKCINILSKTQTPASQPQSVLPARLAVEQGTSVEKVPPSLLDVARCQHLAIPTTAGTGSESTCFAVVYMDGAKQSIEHATMLPQHVILDASLLDTLPLYHKKSAALDTLCQGIESIWAKGATVESKSYAKRAIALTLKNIGKYLKGTDANSARQVLIAANLAGRAINISRTTAPHAMSYKLSTMFGIAHGHAVALCIPHVWQHLIDKANDMARDALDEIAGAIGTKSPKGALATFEKLFSKLDMQATFDGRNSTIQELAASVDPQRLGNHPIEIKQTVLESIYAKLITREQKEKEASLTVYIPRILLLSISMLIVLSIEWLGARFSAPSAEGSVFSIAIPMGHNYLLDYVVYNVVPIIWVNAFLLWGAFSGIRMKISTASDGKALVVSLDSIIRVAYVLFAGILLFFFLLRGGFSLFGLTRYDDIGFNLIRIYTASDFNYEGVFFISTLVTFVLLLLLVIFNRSLKIIPVKKER